MPSERHDDMPLFPLPLVVLPTEVVPLRIFEDRYKTMMRMCIATGQEFGIVWMADDSLHEIGCACVVERVVEELEDGRFNLLARGTRPLRLLERRRHLEYPAALVELLEDAPEPADLQLRTTAQQAYATLVQRATDRPPDSDELAAMNAYAMTATVDFGLTAKQALLSLRSESARLRLATRLFRAAHKRLDFVDRTQARARSNGKVHFG